MQLWTLTRTDAGEVPPVKGLNEFLHRRSAVSGGSYCGAEPVDGRRAAAAPTSSLGDAIRAETMAERRERVAADRHGARA